jgi:tetratricopeptide (TPR) repeat protein
MQIIFSSSSKTVRRKIISSSSAKRFYSTPKVLDLTKNLRETRRKENDEAPEFVDVFSDNYRAVRKETEEKLRQELIQKNIETVPHVIDEDASLKHQECIRKANEEFDANRFSNAVKLYTQCIQLYPKDSFSLSRRAECYIYIGEYELALKDYDQAITLLHGIDSLVLAEYYYHRAVVQFNLKRMDKSLQDYNSCIDIIDRLLQRLGNTHSTEQLNSTIEAELNELMVLALNNRAFILLNSRDLSNEVLQQYNVIEDLTKCILLNELLNHEDSECQQAFYNRARAYHQMQDYESAISDYLKFLELFYKTSTTSYHLTALAALSECYMELDRFDEAIENITLCIEILENMNYAKKDREHARRNQQLAHAYYRRAMCYLGRDRYRSDMESVFSDLNNAVDLSRRSVDVWVRRALVHMFYEYNYTKAFDDLNVAIMRMQGNFMKGATSTEPSLLSREDLLLLRARCNERLGDRESVVADYTAMLTCLHENELPELEQRQYFELSILMNTSTPDVHIVPRGDQKAFMAKKYTKLASLVIENGKELMEHKASFDFSKFVKSALTHLSRAIEIDGNYADAYYQRAALYILLLKQMERLIDIGQFESDIYDYSGKAKADLTRLIELAPEESHAMGYALYNRAVLSYKDGNFQDAIDDLTRVINFKNNRADKLEMLRFRGTIYFKLGQYTSAALDYYYSIK